MHIISTTYKSNNSVAFNTRKATKQLLAHNDLKTTLLKTHVFNKDLNTINPPQSHIHICTK